MDAKRYARLHELFVEAHPLDAASRAQFVARIRTEDCELADEFESLLAAQRAAETEHVEAAAGEHMWLREDAISDARQRLEAIESGAPTLGLIPERIAGFRVLRRIGEGGMGVVYEAEQDAPRRRVALKMMHPTLTSSERARRFKLEAEVLGRLHHPGIAQIFECGTFDLGRGEQPYFAMELVDGVDLRTHAERARLDIDAKLALMALVADAVQHAHERGVVHRDLKPDNVLVDAAGTPKVLDFGVARANDTSQLLSTMVTQTGELIGTLAYMAPEQLSGQPNATTTRVDVYALGVILYQLLSGRLPHEISGLPITAAMRVLTHGEPATLSRVNVRTRGDIETIVAKAMEKDAARRYVSAAALASDIRRYLDHLPISARPASATYRLSKLLHRNRALAIGAASVFIALSLGLISTLWQTRVAHASESVALRQAYSADLVLADDAIENAQLSAARGFLDAAPVSLRGWEWRALSARLDSSARTQARNLPHADRYDWTYRLDLISSPDGDSYWTTDATREGRTRRWSAASGELLAEFPHPDPDAPLTKTALSPDGRRLLMLSNNLVNAEGLHGAEWDTATGRREDLTTPPALDPAHPDSRWFAAFLSPDGFLWLTGTRGAAVWDRERGEARVRIQEPSGIGEAYFNRDGSLVAFQMRAHAEIWIYDTATLERVAATEGYTSGVEDVAFSSDRRRFATASGDATARVWDLTQRPTTCIATLPHSKEVVTVEFSPDNERLATLSSDRNIRVWNSGTGELLDTFGTNDLCSTALAFFSDREVAGLESNGTVVAWNLDSKSTYVFEGHGNPLLGAVPLERAGLIASGAWDGFQGRPGALRFWDAETGDPVASYCDVNEAVYAIAYAPDGVTLAVSVSELRDSQSVRNILFLLNTISGRVARVPLPGTGYALAFDPTSSKLAVRCDGHVRIFNVDSGTETNSIPSTSGSWLDWSHDGALLAVGGRANRGEEKVATVLYDARSLAELRRLEAGDTIAVAFSPDDRRLATGGDDALVRVWDVATGVFVATLAGHDLEIYALAFSPDGQRLASAGHDQAIRLWDTATFDPVARLTGHTDHVASLAWDHSGERLISSSGDNTVRIWETAPVRTRLAARVARKQVLVRVEPLVAKLFEELHDAARVAERITSDTTLGDFERKLARQVALRTALERWPQSERAGATQR